MVLGLGFPQTRDCCSSSMGSLGYSHLLLGKTASAVIVHLGSTFEMVPALAYSVLRHK